MKSKLLFCSVLAAALTAALWAQEQPSGYHSVSCVKVKPGKSAEFRRFLNDAARKLFQARADLGTISAWFELSAAVPQGKAVACDYIGIALYPGLPPAPGMEELAAALKKAGLAMSAQEYIEKRESLVDLSLELWQNRIAVGTLQKGDYLYLNRMKTTKLEEWIETEKRVWQPMAEQWTKDGDLRGWFLNTPVLPGGSELKYQATTVDVFPGWEQAMKYGQNMPETFRKVHPGKDMTHTMEYLSMRDLAVQELYRVEDVVTPAK